MSKISYFIEESVKRSKNFLSDCYSLGKWAYKYLRYQHFRNEIIREEKQKPLFVLGNGPSLSALIDSPIERDQISICTVNFSVLTDSFLQLKPDMHVFAEVEFFDLSDPEIRHLFDYLIEKVDWRMELYAPYGVPDSAIRELGRNKNIVICRFPVEQLNIKGKLLKRLEYSFYRKGVAAPFVMNVIVGCIYCGINRGYKKLYLYGVDHSWMNDIYVGPDNQVYLVDRHYYGVEKRLWYNSATGRSFTMFDLYSNFARLYDSYIRLQGYVTWLRDVEVINRTPESFIDVFPKEIV